MIENLGECKNMMIYQKFKKNLNFCRKTEILLQIKKFEN